MRISPKGLAGLESIYLIVLSGIFVFVLYKYVSIHMTIDHIAVFILAALSINLWR